MPIVIDFPMYQLPTQTTFYFLNTQNLAMERSYNFCLLIGARHKTHYRCKLT